MSEKRFVCKIGPIPVEDGDAWAYFVMPGKAGVSPYMAENDGSGLDQILAEYSPDELECESELAAAAAKVGVHAGEFTPQRAHWLGGMAFRLALGDHLNSVQRESALYGFALAAGAFWTASPWKHRAAMGPMEVQLTGSLKDKLAAMLLGEGAGYGISMYQDLEAIQWLLGRAEADEHEEAARANSLIVTFRDDPPFAADAMRRAYGMPRIPVATKVKNGQGTPLTDLDLLTLGASLKAASYLTDQVSQSTGRITADDLAVEAVVRIMRSEMRGQP